MKAISFGKAPTYATPTGIPNDKFNPNLGTKPSAMIVVGGVTMHVIHQYGNVYRDKFGRNHKIEAA